MQLRDSPSSETLLLQISIASLVILTSIILYVFSKPAFPANAPKLTEDAWPLIGSTKFFTKRWDFYKNSVSRSQTGNFSFYAGKWPIVAVTGHANRKIFFESKQLSLQDGYAALLSGAPEVKESILADDHSNGAGGQCYGHDLQIVLLICFQISTSISSEDCRHFSKVLY